MMHMLYDRRKGPLVAHDGDYTNETSPTPLDINVEVKPSIPPHSHRRKQIHPQRSLKQLDSISDKVLSGVMTIEPPLPWENISPGIMSDIRTTSRYSLPQLMTHFTMENNKYMNFENSLESSRYLEFPSEEDTTIASILGGQRGIAFNTSKNGYRISRSDESDSSIEARRSPMRKRKNHHKSKSNGTIRSVSPHRPITPNNTNVALNTSSTVSRSPAPIGIHLEADLEEAGVSHRKALYEALVIKRRAGTGMGTPLDISSAPGSSLLQDDEFEICCGLRLYPLQYFYSRDTLVANYNSRGFYKKSAAQKMLHIDVNKTGKLYDFLVAKGWLPASSDQRSLDSVRDLPPTSWRVIEPQ